MNEYGKSRNTGSVESSESSSYRFVALEDLSSYTVSLEGKRDSVSNQLHGLKLNFITKHKVCRFSNIKPSRPFVSASVVRERQTDRRELLSTASSHSSTFSVCALRLQTTAEESVLVRRDLPVEISFL